MRTSRRTYRTCAGRGQHELVRGLAEELGGPQGQPAGEGWPARTCASWREHVGKPRSRTRTPFHKNCNDT